MNREVQRLVQDKRKFRRKLVVLEYARECGNNVKSWREFEVSKSTFYLWKKVYEREGRAGLKRRKPVAYTHSKRVPPQVVEKVLQIRRSYQLGPERIMWYLERYHGINVSESSLYRILVRNGMNRLRETTTRRAIHTKHYSKAVPGHHIQADVKFLMPRDRQDRPAKRFQYTAIDDATRIRVMKFYPRHNQDYAIKFIDHAIEKMPFRIRMVRTDNGHEFQARFHWHLLDLGIEHVYIRPRRPYLNGKVERSHRTDEEEFYQLLKYKDGVDLNEKLEEWEKFYNLHRLHTALDGKTPYEVLRSLLY